MNKKIAERAFEMLAGTCNNEKKDAVLAITYTDNKHDMVTAFVKGKKNGLKNLLVSAMMGDDDVADIVTAAAEKFRGLKNR